jgi:hypothetical protein
MAIHHASITKTAALAKFGKRVCLNRDDLDFAGATLLRLPE